MANLAKIMQQAQQMQREMEKAQAALASERIETSVAGGAVRVAITGQGDFLAVHFDPDFLKGETPGTIEATTLQAIQEAAAAAKARQEKLMGGLTAGLKLPGM